MRQFLWEWKQWPKKMIEEAVFVLLLEEVEVKDVMAVWDAVTSLVAGKRSSH